MFYISLVRGFGLGLVFGFLFQRVRILSLVENDNSSLRNAHCPVINSFSFSSNHQSGLVSCTVPELLTSISF